MKNTPKKTHPWRSMMARDVKIAKINKEKKKDDNLFNLTKKKI